MAEFIFGALTMFTVLFVTGLCVQRKADDTDERLTVAKRRVK